MSEIPTRKLKRIKVMKSLAVRQQGDKKVFAIGGNFRYYDAEEELYITMNGGEVREVPESVVKEANSHSRSNPVFVKPGSQKVGMDKDKAHNLEV